MTRIVSQLLITLIIIFFVVVVIEVAGVQRSNVRPGGVQVLLLRVAILALPRIGFGQRLLTRFRCTRGAERCDLDNLAAEEHVRQAKAPADEAAITEEFSDLLR
jgi:hypothetical protein